MKFIDYQAAALSSLAAISTKNELNIFCEIWSIVEDILNPEKTFEKQELFETCSEKDWYQHMNTCLLVLALSWHQNVELHGKLGNLENFKYFKYIMNTEKMFTVVTKSIMNLIGSTKIISSKLDVAGLRTLTRIIEKSVQNEQNIVFVRGLIPSFCGYAESENFNVKMTAFETLGTMIHHTKGLYFQ